MIVYRDGMPYLKEGVVCTPFACKRCGKPCNSHDLSDHKFIRGRPYKHKVINNYTKTPNF